MDKIIIVSPCKEMNRQWGNQKLSFDYPSDIILSALKRLQAHELAQLFKLSDPLAMEVYHDYQVINEATAKPAYETYRGLAFRQFDWSKIDMAYAHQHLMILSALYGPISICQPINPYRLDFNTPLKVDNYNLKQLWRPIYQQVFKDKLVYNLASKEFSQLLNSKITKIVAIEFYDSFSTSIKLAPSATTKKLRGQLANHLLQLQDFSEETFRLFSFEDYVYSEASLLDQKIIYVKK